MKFTLDHVNVNVTDVDRSIAFYQKALGLKELRRKESPKYKIVFLTDEAARFKLELTWLADKKGKYELGDNEGHIGFVADDYAAAHKLHDEMKCICYENKDMGIYFIEDPDGYWLEVTPPKR